MATMVAVGYKQKVIPKVRHSLWGLFCLYGMCACRLFNDGATYSIAHKRSQTFYIAGINGVYSVGKKYDTYFCNGVNKDRCPRVSCVGECEGGVEHAAVFTGHGVVFPIQRATNVLESIGYACHGFYGMLAQDAHAVNAAIIVFSCVICFYCSMHDGYSRWLFLNSRVMSIYGRVPSM